MSYKEEFNESKWKQSYKRKNKAIDLKKTIEVLIVNFEIKKLKELGYHSKWKIIEEKERKLILTEHLELHIIEIPKKSIHYKNG